MDLGSSICTPKKPACALCPLNEDCVVRARGDQESFPRKAPKKAGTLRRGAAFVVTRGDELLVRSRAEKGLRGGMTEDGRTKLKTPSGTLSTAEAISVVTGGMALATHFGDGRLRAVDVAAGIVGAVVKDPVADRVIWQEYLETVARERDGWKDFYRAAREA